MLKSELKAVAGQSTGSVAVSKRGRQPSRASSPSHGIGRKLLWAVTGLTVAGMYTQAAQASTWIGDTDQDWNLAANWDSDPANPTGNFTINSTVVGVYPILSSNSAFTPVDIIIGVGAGGRFDQRAGTLNTGNGNWFVVGRNNGGAGTFNLADTSTTGGTLTGFALGSGSLNVGGASTTGGRMIVADGGTSTGTVNMNTSGTLKLEDDGIGLLLGTNGTSVGNFNLDAGTLLINAPTATGIAILAGTNGGDGNFKMSGGTVTASGGIWAGDNNAGSQGLIEISGGSFTATSTGAIGGTGAGQNFIGRGLGQGLLNITGGSVTFTGGTNVGFSNTATAGTSGTVSISGGTFLNTGEMRVGAAQNANGVTARSSGTLSITGGIATVTGSLLFARGNDAGDLVTGTGTVSGTGTLNVQGDLVVAFAGNANVGQLNINTGGTVNAGSAAERWVMVNQWDTAQGQLIVNGGTLNLFTNTDIRFSAGNGVGASVVTLSGGAITGYNGNNIGSGLSASSVVDLMQANVAGNNTFNLDGGTLTINQIITAQNAGTAAFNFNGGTLRAAGSSANFVDLGGGAQTAVVKAGGAVIDSNGFSVTAVQALIDGGTGGGLSKLGTGTLNLSGTNTYTGTTSVTAGTLALTGTGSINNSGSVIVNGSGAKFLQTSSTASTTAITLTQGTVDGTGTVGNVTVGPGTGGVVSNGNGTTAQLTATSLTFLGAGALNLRITGGATTATAAIVVTNGLTTSGSPGSVLVSLTPTSPLVLGSTYNLVGYGTTATGNATDFVYAGNTARITGTFGNSSNFITLTVNGDTPKWTGLDNSSWVVGATGANDNWKLVTANTATDYIEGDIVLFDDSATGTTSVTINSVLNPASTSFNNSALDYTISGTGGIASGILTKDGTSKVLVTTTNTTTGIISINAGTLQLGDGTTDGSFANASSITNNGTLAYNVTGTQTYAGVISGTGGVVKDGSGTVIHGGANTYSGGTAINGGTLQITTTAGAANTGVFNLNGGTFQVNLGTGADFNYAPTVILISTSTLGNAAAGALNNTNGQINFTGTVNGNGNVLNVANTGLARLYLNGTLNNVSQINVQSGAAGFEMNNGNNRGAAPVSIANGAALWFAGNNGNPITNNLTFNGGNGINGGGALYYEGGTPNPAALTGNITLDGGITGIGSDFADNITLSGVISGAGGLTKLGTGTYRLTGTNTYTGATTISAGTLQIGNGTTDGSITASSNITNNAALVFNLIGNHTYATPIAGTGALTKSGAGTLTLSGTNTYTGVTTVNTGGMLALTGANTLSTGNVVLNNGATLRLEANVGNTTAGSSSAIGSNTGAGSTGLQLGNNSSGTVNIQLRSDSSVEFANTTTGNNSGNVTLNFNVDNISTGQNQVLAFAPASETGRNGGLGLSTFNTNIIANGGNGYGLALGKITSFGNQLTINAATANVTVGSMNTTGASTFNYTGAGTTTVTGNVTGNVAILNRETGGTLIIQGAGSTYTGVTNVNGGTLLVNGTHTGGGVYTVADTATLGGNGSIATAGDASVLVNGGGKLAPGSAAGTIGTITMNLGAGNLDVSGATSGASTGGLVFDLGPTTSSGDQVLLSSGTLIVGDTLDMSDFSFTTATGVEVGTYVLFDTNNTITNFANVSTANGVFGDGYLGNLSLGNDNQDLLLTVSVPEPSALALLGFGATGLLGRRRRRQASAV